MENACNTILKYLELGFTSLTTSMDYEKMLAHVWLLNIVNICIIIVNK